MVREIRTAANGRVGRMWSNWAGDQTCSPTRTLRPRTAGEIASAPGPLRVPGSGHSFSDCALTDGTLLDLAALDTIEIEIERGRARVGAGVTLRAIPRALRDAGLALANLGDIDAQTVAGAVST